MEAPGLGLAIELEGTVAASHEQVGKAVAIVVEPDDRTGVGEGEQAPRHRFVGKTPAPEVAQEGVGQPAATGDIEVEPTVRVEVEGMEALPRLGSVEPVESHEAAARLDLDEGRPSFRDDLGSVLAVEVPEGDRADQRGLASQQAHRKDLAFRRGACLLQDRGGHLLGPHPEGGEGEVELPALLRRRGAGFGTGLHRGDESLQTRLVARNGVVGKGQGRVGQHREDRRWPGIGGRGIGRPPRLLAGGLRGGNDVLHGLAGEPLEQLSVGPAGPLFRNLVGELGIAEDSHAGQQQHRAPDEEGHEEGAEGEEDEGSLRHLVRKSGASAPARRGRLRRRGLRGRARALRAGRRRGRRPPVRQRS